MNKSRYEICRGAEILTNGKYKELPSLQGLVPDIEKSLGQLLSIRIYPLNKIAKDQLSIQQYNIETQNYITNITTHNGLDLHLFQHDKHTKSDMIYTPYSSPGYEVYAYLICAYHEMFKKAPVVSFPFTDVDSWNDARKHHDLPLQSEMQNTAFNLYPYLHFSSLFTEDKTGISRIIRPGKEDQEWHEEGFGTTKDAMMFQAINHFHQSPTVHRFTVEKELINLFLQAFIDVNRSVSGEIVNLHLKKIGEVLLDTLNDPAKRANQDYYSDLWHQDLSKT